MTEPIKLGNTSIDIITSITKGGVGAVPVVGSLIGEIIGNVIPNQRVDRIVKFVQLLEERIGKLEAGFVKERFAQPGVVDVLEDAFIQASRATTEDRLRHIATVVANGVSADQLNEAETKRMIWLLGQLNDLEIILLRGKLPMSTADYPADAEFQDKHEQVLRPPALHLGSPKADIEQGALHDSHLRHLVDLGLLRPRFKRVSRSELPEFDDRTGMMKASGYEVSTLGRMLLRYLNLIPEWYKR